MEEEEAKEELTRIAIEHLELKNKDLESTVNLITDFSIKNSLSPEFLYDLSKFHGSNTSFVLSYIFAKSYANLSTGSAKAIGYSIVGVLSAYMGRWTEAEENYKLVLGTNQNNVEMHFNCALLLAEMNRLEEAELHYKLALNAKPDSEKKALIYNNYGELLYKMGRLEEAEKKYKLALKANPSDGSSYSFYASFLVDTNRLEEAEKQHKSAVEVDPNDYHVHLIYGFFLGEMGRLDEAEEQCKIAIKLEPKKPFIHSFYSSVLLGKDLEKQAEEEIRIVTSLHRENGDLFEEHLHLASFYEQFADKYNSLGKYLKSGEYAEIAGNEYIQAGEFAGETYRADNLTKGYSLKGRAEIRKLRIEPSIYKIEVKKLFHPEDYDTETLVKIIECVAKASKFYTKAAETSPENSQICVACSNSMSCLSEMLDYMYLIIKQGNTPELEHKLEVWNEKLGTSIKVYKERNKGILFIESLRKLMDCIQNLDKYQKTKTRGNKKTVEECIIKLLEIADNIEGPLQDILGNAAGRIDKYLGKAKLYSRSSKSQMVTEPKKLSLITGGAINYLLILLITIFGTAIANVYGSEIVNFIKKIISSFYFP